MVLQQIKKMISLIRKAVELGITLFDTEEANAAFSTPTIIYFETTLLLSGIHHFILMRDTFHMDCSKVLINKVIA